MKQLSQQRKQKERVMSGLPRHRPAQHYAIRFCLRVGCTEPHYRNGWCEADYISWLKGHEHLPLKQIAEQPLTMRCGSAVCAFPTKWQPNCLDHANKKEGG